jgi:hypothetical protein
VVAIDRLKTSFTVRKSILCREIVLPPHNNTEVAVWLPQSLFPSPPFPEETTTVDPLIVDYPK